MYGSTGFRLNQRAQTAGGRAEIWNCGDAMPRGGVDALQQQLWAEIMKR
ncbi:MAG TPA: hypothetical protein VI136_23930 [Verrucomicrobiae bacterium]